MHHAQTIARIQRKSRLLLPEMDERRRRPWAAAEAREVGWGGVSLVARATGLSRPTITAGLRDLEQPTAERAAEATRIRRRGGGRPPATRTDPGWLAAVEPLLEPATRGDPMSPLRGTCKSTRRLAAEWTRMEHPVGPRTVAALLHEAGYSLQANRQTRAGGSHPDRNAQSESINASVGRVLLRGQPAIAVDTKKKEWVGDFQDGGREWHPRGAPEEVRVPDFLDKTPGEALPCGVYDMLRTEGWVSVGIDHDTAQSATARIRRWWSEMGQGRSPKASGLLITADGGGSHGHRTRRWKVSLQALADELGLTLLVGHFPPGTSQWDKIEHRLFSFRTQNGRGRPLVRLQAIVSLIASTTTRTGRMVEAALDPNQYATAIKVSDVELAGLQRQRPEFHGDWNYTISPRRK